MLKPATGHKPSGSAERRAISISFDADDFEAISDYAREKHVTFAAAAREIVGWVWTCLKRFVGTVGNHRNPLL